MTLSCARSPLALFDLWLLIKRWPLISSSIKKASKRLRAYLAGSEPGRHSKLSEDRPSMELASTSGNGCYGWRIFLGWHDDLGCNGAWSCIQRNEVDHNWMIGRCVPLLSEWYQKLNLQWHIHSIISCRPFLFAGSSSSLDSAGKRLLFLPRPFGVATCRPFLFAGSSSSLDSAGKRLLFLPRPFGVATCLPFLLAGSSSLDSFWILLDLDVIISSLSDTKVRSPSSFSLIFPFPVLSSSSPSVSLILSVVQS